MVTYETYIFLAVDDSKSKPRVFRGVSDGRFMVVIALFE